MCFALRSPHLPQPPTSQLSLPATCFASSARLFREMFSGPEEGRPAAVGRYLRLLRAGGDDHPMEQLRRAGVDLALPETMRAVVEEMDALVARLEAEADRLAAEK